MRPRATVCGGRTVAALPQKRRRYFRHKGSRPEGCTNESYLHAAAKHAVAEAIREAIRDRRPYNLFVTTPILCDRYEATFGLACGRRSRSFAYDLTQRFDEVGIEERVGRFSAVTGPTALIILFPVRGHGTWHVYRAIAGE